LILRRPAFLALCVSLAPVEKLGERHLRAMFTTTLSNTVCVSVPGEQSGSLTPTLVEELAAHGEIARLDASLSAVLKSVFVTYYDVRCAQAALAELGHLGSPFPAAEHDYRSVQVPLGSDAAKVGLVAGFTHFGEVANVSVTQDNLLVEFFDFRSAQRLLAAAGGSVVPGPVSQAAGAAAASTNGNALGSTPCHAAPVAPPTQPATASAALETAMKASTGAGNSPTMAETAAAGKLQRSKIANKDFSKFDIHPAKILSGEDIRTTVMVRNLLGARARKDFLRFLDVSGLGDRYTFFYMPCKEHREVRAGFAFVNFKAAADVRRLFEAVHSNMWMQIRTSDTPYKPLAMSYARFQGHDELASHFSTSVVIHERDPEKRPIFRLEGDEASKAHEAPTPPSGRVPTPTTTASTASSSPVAGSPTAKHGAHAGAPHSEAERVDFREALQKGILELSNLIAMEHGLRSSADPAALNQGSEEFVPPPPGLAMMVDPMLIGA